MLQNVLRKYDFNSSSTFQFFWFHGSEMLKVEGWIWLIIFVDPRLISSSALIFASFRVT